MMGIIVLFLLIVFEINIIFDEPRRKEDQYEQELISRIEQKNQESKIHNYLLSNPEQYIIDDDPIYKLYRKENK